MIRIEDLNKIYETKDMTVTALKNINLDIPSGEIFGIIGLSGAGKSTLVRTLNRLEDPTSGSIFIDDVDITGLNRSELRNIRKEIGMIFQHFNLMNSKNIFKNIAFPLEIVGMKREDIEVRVSELLDLVDLSDKANSFPSQLSGGQKQRVAIARALANNPKVLLCDEATSALDPKTTKSILNLLKDIQKQFGLTIVLITHQMEVIREICERVAIIEGGEIIEIGDVEDVFSNPKTDIGKAFVSDLKPSSSSGDLVFPKTPNSKVIRLGYLGDSAKEPIISNLIRKFDIDVNIIDGDINKLTTVLVGHLIIQILGEKTEIENAFEWLKEKDLSLEVIYSG